MTTPMASPRISPELRTGAFYFTMFMSSGVVTAYAGIWWDLGEPGTPKG